MACIIPGCNNAADNNLTIRLRRADTSAIWAPNTNAFMCDVHAVSGVKLTLLVETADDSRVKTKVCGVETPTSDRNTAIRNPA